MKLFIILYLSALVLFGLYILRVWLRPEYRKPNFERMRAEMIAKERRRDRDP